jgi:GNAT superfamily N-acetyltransferase
MPAPHPVAELVIRTIADGDRELWEPLWRDYLDFYETTVPQEATELTWTRLTTTREVEGFLACGKDGEALGLVHFFCHPSTFNIGSSCYLEDLYVIPAARGKRVGRRLIAAVVEAAKAKGAEVVYWQTEEFNGTARRLYERVAKRAPLVRYQIEI